MESAKYFDLLLILIAGLIWIALLLWLKKKKRFLFLIFFTVFYIYIYNVLDFTLFQIQSLLILKLFTPKLILNGIEAEKSINLLPLITLTSEDVKTSLLNILLFVPFGFGLPFITNFQMKIVIVIGMFFSIGIELLQFLTGYLAKITFRIADINDVIFNTVGATIGYVLFLGVVCVCRNWKFSNNSILKYIIERSQIK